jgi:TPR repeat protein
MPIERRRAPRKTLADLAFINLEPDNGGIVVDVSEDGLGFHSAVPVEASGPIKFWFSIRSIDRLDATGTVAWTDDSRKSGGIKFVELNDDVRARLRSWLGDAATKATNDAGLTPGVTPGSPAEVARQAAERAAVSSGMFGSLRRDPPVPAAKDTPAAIPAVRPSSETKSAAQLAAPAAQDSSAKAPAANEGARPNIFTSPLSLLATERSPNDASAGEHDSAQTQFDSADISDSAARDRAALPMIVVVFAAIAVTVVGYYTLRWKSQPRPIAPQQQESLPISQEAPPVAPPSAPTDSAATQSSTSAIPTPQSSSSPANNNASVKQPANSGAAPADIEAAGKAQLDEALRLLRGASATRDPARAAQLLWSAVGNGSVIAEVELARLYITGVGVRKNCEQARVLLRAAISRGSDDATNQLAELARTGCTK